MNTKGIIESAAFSLFREFPFDSITVQMILNKAEVSRKTFYKYYADKYELMELFYRRSMDSYIQQQYDGHNWEEIVGYLYDFILLDKSYFRHVNDLTGQGSFWDFLREYSMNFYSSVKLHNEQRASLTEEERIAIIMMVEAQMALMKMLVEDKTHIGRATFAKLLVTPMPQSYKDVLIEDPPYHYIPTSDK